MDTDPTARTGWTTYDDFSGTTLDASLWQPADFGSGPRLEPEARTTIENGVITVDVPRFMNSDPAHQGLDNTKHLLLSTQAFKLPADGVARFAADLRAVVGDGSGDYRQGFASFTLADTTGGTYMVFNILSTGDRILAEEEVLPAPGHETAFTRVVEDPFFFARAGTTPGSDFHRCEIEIDRSRGRVVWMIDGRVLHQAAGLAGLPEDVHIGFGMFTLLPLGEGEGSCHGQGGRASWRNVQYSLPAANSWQGPKRWMAPRRAAVTA